MNLSGRESGQEKDNGNQGIPDQGKGVTSFGRSYITFSWAAHISTHNVPENLHNSASFRQGIFTSRSPSYNCTRTYGSTVTASCGE